MFSELNYVVLVANLRIENRSVTSVEKTWLNQQPELRQWYQGAVGQALLGHAKQRLDLMLPQVFGFRGVQVGQIAPDMPLLERAGLMRSFVVDPEGAAVGADMVGDATKLPLCADSFNLVFLPHTLDFCEQPHHVLREADRLLTSDGYLLLMGFNLFSRFGVRRAAQKWRGGVPWQGHFFTRGRVADWLSVLNFQIVEVAGVSSGSISTPIRGGFGEQIRGLREYYSPVYMVLARKRTVPLNPSIENWAARRPRAANVVTGLFSDGARRGNTQRESQPPTPPKNENT